ncbi:bifunctional nuclease family protein [Georgenia sp. Z1344]|uniref:bifunctional nuclease family protein n=1 Tax=Georgenia sp. Z1344 TaxID=3416706 RepID=UPI003CF24D6D
MEVQGVEVTLDGARVVLLLKDPSSGRVLPIVVGAREGAAIASVQAGLVPPRPLTHDLMLSAIRTLGSEVVAVVITAQLDGVFYAELVLSTGETIDCRPSDGVALALRAGAPIRCVPELLPDLGAVQVGPGAGAGTASGIGGRDKVGRGTDGAAIEDAVAELRRELEGLGPDDFGAPDPSA